MKTLFIFVLTVVYISCVPERRVSQAQREHETIEADLSSMFPKVRCSNDAFRSFGTVVWFDFIVKTTQ